MKNVVLYFAKKIRENKIGAYAAQSALFLIMSAIPFLLVLLSLLRFTPVTEEVILAGIEFISPDLVSDSVVRIVDEVYENAAGVLLISVIIAIYSAAKTIQSLRTGLNLAYDMEETRNWFILRLRAMIETFALILMILLLMILLMFGQTIQGILVEYMPWVAVVTEVILRYRMLILFFVLILLLVVIYKALPNRKMTFRSQFIGAILCAGAWYVLTFALSIYINYFNGFSFYGSLTSIVLIMFWLYIAMYIFLVCGMVNSSMERVLLEIKLTIQMRRKQKKKAAETKAQIELLDSIDEGQTIDLLDSIDEGQTIDLLGNIDEGQTIDTMETNQKGVLHERKVE